MYGDLFMLCYDEKNRIKDFSVTDYAELYDIINEGFDECLTEDSEDSELDSEEEDSDYDKEESEEEHDFEIVNSDDSELDTDNNNY